MTSSTPSDVGLFAARDEGNERAIAAARLVELKPIWVRFATHVQLTQIHRIEHVWEISPLTLLASVVGFDFHGLC